MSDAASVRILRPLRHRDYRLLAMGSLVSLLGDGVFLAAIAFQVFAVRNEAAAMSLVGLVWAGAQVAFLLVGGWASDRFERRRVMLAADVLRAAAIGTMGLLSVTGNIELWHIVVLGGCFGIGNAFFNPAATAIVPDLLPASDLPQANAFLGTAKPFMQRLVGPAIGGFVVAAAGPGVAFLIDAATFVVSAAFLLAVSPGVSAPTGDGRGLSPGALAEGVRFVWSHTWCWAWMLGAALSLLAFYGPSEVLLPFLLINDPVLGLDTDQAARQFGLILAVGGLGSVCVSLLVGQLDLPRRFVTAMYLAEAAAVGLLVVYGLMTAAWWALIASLVMNGLYAFTDIAWTTLLQRRVPRHLLGRVSSVDWITSIGLVPLSFAIAGPLAERFGPRPVLVAGGVAGALVLLGLSLLPGVRDPERDPEREATIAATPSARS